MGVSIMFLIRTSLGREEHRFTCAVACFFLRIRPARGYVWKRLRIFFRKPGFKGHRLKWLHPSYSALDQPSGNGSRVTGPGFQVLTSSRQVKDIPGMNTVTVDSINFGTWDFGNEQLKTRGSRWNKSSPGRNHHPLKDLFGIHIHGADGLPGSSQVISQPHHRPPSHSVWDHLRTSGWVKFG